MFAKLKSLKPVFILAVIASLSCTVAPAQEGKIIAVYGRAVATTNPPPGWNFLWNANGEIGDSKGYVSLDYDKSRKKGRYGVLDEAGISMPDKPYGGKYAVVYGIRDKDGIARFFIASYTMQDDSSGEVWINNGNIQNRPLKDGTTLAIYLNDELKFSAQVKKDRLPTLFQKNMGKLKKGDSIRVAVGPGEKSNKGGTRLSFIIEEFQAGHKPGDPINIISPPITSPSPQRGPDGKYDNYLNKHKVQCEAVLTNKPELVFIGDSITSRWPMELLQEKFGKYRPVNLGIGGDWIQNVIWRVLNGVFDKVRIKVIVVLIGTNNLSNGFTPDDVVEGTAFLIKVLHEKSPGSKILLLGILPCGETIRNSKCEKIRQVNAKTALLADNKTVFFLDIGDKLVEPDGTISREVMPDKLHVALPGFIRWVKAMSPTLNKLLEDN